MAMATAMVLIVIMIMVGGPDQAATAPYPEPARCCQGLPAGSGVPTPMERK
jgi:hypothetical protein